MRFWGTPPELYALLNERFGPFDCDPCPNPRPDGYDGLTAPWGVCNYVNPPFGAPGEWVKRAIALREEGKASLLVLPITHWTNVLLKAGAILYPLGRVKWRELETGIPCDWKHRPGLTGAFYLG